MFKELGGIFSKTGGGRERIESNPLHSEAEQVESMSPGDIEQQGGADQEKEAALEKLDEEISSMRQAKHQVEAEVKRLRAYLSNLNVEITRKARERKGLAKSEVVDDGEEEEQEEGNSDHSISDEEHATKGIDKAELAGKALGTAIVGAYAVKQKVFEAKVAATVVASRTADRAVERLPEERREQLEAAKHKVAEQAAKVAKQVATKAGVMVESTYDTYLTKNKELKVKGKELQTQVYENMSDDAKRQIKETNEWLTEKKEQAKVKALDMSAPLVDKLLNVLNKLIKQKVAGRYVAVPIFLHYMLSDLFVRYVCHLKTLILLPFYFLHFPSLYSTLYLSYAVLILRYIQPVHLPMVQTHPGGACGRPLAGPGPRAERRHAEGAAQTQERGPRGTDTEVPPLQPRPSLGALHPLPLR